ncbi:transposase [Neobacillus sp.]|jgi:transposase|uniref:transposase n=1 Tax=Neobacillus sp. TaxID=2675273 RepID=UPI0037CA0BC0
MSRANKQYPFDKFHVMKLVNEALDQVRSQEQIEQPALKNTRFLWLKNQKNLNSEQHETALKLLLLVEVLSYLI